MTDEEFKALDDEITMLLVNPGEAGCASS